MTRMLLIGGLFFALAASARADLLDDGATLLGQGKFAEAVEILKKELNAHPTNTKAYMYLATAHEKLSQWADAASAWDKFVKLTESVDERNFGEKRAKECRDRAAGKVPVEAKTPAETPEPPSEFSKYEKQEPVFFSPVKTAHFIVMAKNRALAEDTVKEAERHLSRITDVFLFGRAWTSVITIRVFKDHRDYVIEAGMPQWSGGGYSVQSDGAGGMLRRIDLFALDPKGKYIDGMLTKTLPHEMTHVVLHEYFGERTFATLPRAVNEGLAMYSEEGTSVLYEKELADAVKKDHYYKFNELFTMMQYPPNVGLFYAESASATRYLVEHLKASEFQNFLEEVRKGNTVNSALQTALARTGDLLGPMQTNWVEMLKGKADEYAKGPAKTPATKTPPPKKTEDTGKEPYDPAKNEKKTPGGDDDDKDIVEEYK